MSLRESSAGQEPRKQSDGSEGKRLHVDVEVKDTQQWKEWIRAWPDALEGKERLRRG